MFNFFHNNLQGHSAWVCGDSPGEGFMWTYSSWRQCVGCWYTSCQRPKGSRSSSRQRIPRWFPISIAKGGIRSHIGARWLLLWEHSRGVSLWAVYLPRKGNGAANLLSRRMAAPPRHRAGHLGLFQPGSGGPLCLPGDYSLPLVVFHGMPQGHIGGGSPSIHVAPGPSVRFFPLSLSCQRCWPEVRMLQATVLLVAPDWLHQPWMAELVTLPVGITWCLQARPDMLSQVQGLLWHPNPGIYRLPDLGAAVMVTLQAARAPSTRWLHAGCWNMFCAVPEVKTWFLVAPPWF